MTWWVHDAYQNGGVIYLFSWIFWVLFSIVLHELAHGWAAIANGDNTPRELGHITANPVVHMGWSSLIFFAIAGIAWGMMPTNPSRYRNERRGRVLVAAAGPAMNLLLAFLSLTGLAFWIWASATGRISPEKQTFTNTALFLYLGGFLNLVLACFNMLPVPPLDGSQVLAGASRRLAAFYQRPDVQAYGMILVLLVFFTTIDAPLQRALRDASDDYVVWVTEKLTGPSPAEPG
jgi:Zn-dependent protease